MTVKFLEYVESQTGEKYKIKELAETPNVTDPAQILS